METQLKSKLHMAKATKLFIVSILVTFAAAVLVPGISEARVIVRTKARTVKVLRVKNTVPVRTVVVKTPVLKVKVVKPKQKKNVWVPGHYRMVNGRRAAWIPGHWKTI